jgi:hypothetical protein
MGISGSLSVDLIKDILFRKTTMGLELQTQANNVNNIVACNFLFRIFVKRNKLQSLFYRMILFYLPKQ